MPTDYAASLAAALSKSAACVGLDPVLEKLPEPLRAEHWEPVRAIDHFCRAVLDALAAAPRPVSIVKPQAACFERYGSQGWSVLEHTVRHARDLGMLVILDAKRGDIGVSAEHYAAAAASLGAHAVTVNAYLGPETVEPYLAAGLGVFVLVRTSNPGSDAVQSCPLRDGGDVAEMMARHVDALGRSRAAGAHAPPSNTPAPLSPVGAVVGATKAGQGPALRRLMPDTPFLVPGYGAQGGTADDVRRLLRPGAAGPAQGGVIVNSSRGVLYPTAADPARWRESIAAAASAFVDDIARLFTPAPAA
jgi:orotidine-5'-phosphate decarboxylase